MTKQDIEELRLGLGQIAVAVRGDGTMVRCCRLVDEVLEAQTLPPEQHRWRQANLHAAALEKAGSDYRKDVASFVADLRAKEATIAALHRSLKAVLDADQYDMPAACSAARAVLAKP